MNYPINVSVIDTKNLTVISKQTVLNKDFTVYGTIENPLFLAKDVAEWIDYDSSSINKMLSSVDEDEKLVGTIFRVGQNRETWFLTENGLYEVLMLSRKPIAKQFKKEVKKVLHQIRTTGGYTVPKTFVEALKLAVEQQEEIEALKKECIELKPDAESWRAFAEKDGTFCVTKVASCLNLQPKTIFNYLETKGYITRSSGRWAGTVLGTTKRGYISNDIVAGEKYSAIQMRLTVKGMQKVAEAFGKTRESIELTAEAYAEKGTKEYERILAETTDKWLKKNSTFYRSE